MKTLFALLMTVLIASSIRAGDNLKEVKRRVGNTLILQNWKVGETKIINDISVLRMTGENRIEGRTNLLYSDGCVHLFFDRESEEAADGKWMSISISHASDPSILEMQMPSNQPRAYRFGIWYNFITIPVDENLPEDFLVTVKDGFDGRVYEFAVAQPIEGINNRISAKK